MHRGPLCSPDALGYFPDPQGSLSCRQIWSWLKISAGCWWPSETNAGTDGEGNQWCVKRHWPCPLFLSVAVTGVRGCVKATIPHEDPSSSPATKSHYRPEQSVFRKFAHFRVLLGGDIVLPTTLGNPSFEKLVIVPFLWPWCRRIEILQIFCILKSGGKVLLGYVNSHMKGTLNKLLSSSTPRKTKSSVFKKKWKVLLLQWFS